jgi:hypothetical protein
MKPVKSFNAERIWTRRAYLSKIQAFTVIYMKWKFFCTATTWSTERHFQYRETCCFYLPPWSVKLLPHSTLNDALFPVSTMNYHAASLFYSEWSCPVQLAPRGSKSLHILVWTLPLWPRSWILLHFIYPEEFYCLCHSVLVYNTTSTFYYERFYCHTFCPKQPIASIIYCEWSYLTPISILMHSASSYCTETGESIFYTES